MCAREWPLGRQGPAFNTLTHQEAPSLLRKKAESMSNFHENMYPLLDFIMSHDTADFQCKYLSFVQFEFGHSNKIIIGTRKKEQSVGLEHQWVCISWWMLVKHTHAHTPTRTHANWILNQFWSLVIINFLSFSQSICSFSLNTMGMSLPAHHWQRMKWKRGEMKRRKGRT